MAVVYPRSLRDEVRVDPRRAAEVRVYDALARLDDEWTVLYSVDWRFPDKRHRLQRGEADFLVLHPGLGWMVIEVKGGGVSRVAQTGAWSTIDRHGERHPLKRPPLVQAERSARAMQRMLASRLPPASLEWLPWTCAAWLPDVTTTPDWLGPDAPRALFALSTDVGDPEAWLRGVFAKDARPVGSDAERRRTLVERIVALLAPSWEIAPNLASEVASHARRIDQLTAEQARALRGLRANTRVLVTGGAGTGKTVLALETATALAAQGQRTLLGCFNRPLSRWLAARGEEVLRARCPDGELDGLLTTSTIPALAVQALSLAGTPPAKDDYERSEFWEELPERFLAALANLPDLRFDAVVIDEAQDLPPLWWTPIEELLAHGGDSLLWVFGDDNQNIYGGSHDVAAEIRATRFQLSANLRNTRPIHGCIAQFYEGDLEAAGPDGRPVVWETVDAREDIGPAIAARITQLITDDGLTRGDIAVLTGTRQGSALLGRRKIGPHRTCTAEAPQPGRVVADTIHHFKGLERPVVILAELEAIPDEHARELLYVGGSRARDLLIIIEGPRPADGAS